MVTRRTPGAPEDPPRSPPLFVPVLSTATLRAWPKHPSARRVPYVALGVALSQEYGTDAHTAAYSVPSKPFRLCDSPPAYGECPGVAMALFFGDLDDPATHGTKAPARAEWRAEQAPRLAHLEAAHPGVFVYETRGGIRIVWRLASSFPIRSREDADRWARAYIRACAYLAARFGLVLDPKCRDWTRLYRLPRVTREGSKRPEARPTIGDPHAVGTWALPDRATPEMVAAARALAGDVAHPQQAEAWRQALPYVDGRIPDEPGRGAPRGKTSRPVDGPRVSRAAWDRIVAHVAPALAPYTGVVGVPHKVHLALAGACYLRGVPLHDGPDLGEAIATAAGEGEKASKRRAPWESTAKVLERADTARGVLGYGWLRTHYLAVADALDAALPQLGKAKEVRARLDARGIPPEIPPEEAARAIRKALEEAPPGLTLLRVTEGAGKTHAVGTLAVDRAEAIGTEKIPGEQRLALVTGMHDVAAPVFERWQALGVPALYLQSALRTGECAYHVPAAALVRAGHSLDATLCRGVGYGSRGSDAKCSHYDGCPARAAARQEANKREGQGILATVSVHQLLNAALGHVGPHGTLVVDEDPTPFITATLGAAELDAALAVGGWAFNHGAARYLLVARVLVAGLEGAAAGEDLETVFARGCRSIDPEELRREFDTADPRGAAEFFAAFVAYREAQSEGGSREWVRREQWAPRLTAVTVARARAKGVPDYVETTSGTLALVARMFAGVFPSAPPGTGLHPERATVSVECDERGARLRIVLAAGSVLVALGRREGPTVLADATADVDMLRVAAGGPDAPLKVVDLRVADGLQARRLLLYWSHASRKQCLTAGEPRWEAGLAGYLAEALRLAAPPDGGRVGLITWKPLADTLRAALEDPAAAPEAAGALAPLLRRGVRVVVGHYGALRGRNDWNGVDALITFGDPRPNVTASHAVADALRLDRGAQYAHAIGAELSQAHGRLRAPWVAKNVTAVHVGAVPPLSWDARTVVLELPQGRARVDREHLVTEGLSVRDAARAAGVSERTVEGARAQARASGNSSTVGNGCPSRKMPPTKTPEVFQKAQKCGSANHSKTHEKPPTAPVVPLHPRAPPTLAVPVALAAGAEGQDTGDPIEKEFVEP